MSRKKSRQKKKFKREGLSRNSAVVQETWDRQSSRMSEGAINFMDELSPGFEEWYRENYDDEGRYVWERIKRFFA
jgi:hypothetical protein